MRSVIIDALFEKMSADKDIFFLNADMGINLVERFEQHFPSRYLNVGIAEQNLISVSSGLANVGYRPFAYTISNFIIHRCFEQIRNDICLHKYPVTLIGTSTGFDNSPLGPTHHIVDDWGPLRSFPGIDIYCPSSVIYASTLIEKVIENSRPAYIRIPKGNFESRKNSLDIDLVKGSNNETLIITYGGLVEECLRLQNEDPDISVLIINKLHPLPQEELATLFSNYKLIITLEDHFALNGLYSSICEIIASQNLKVRIKKFAPKDYMPVVGKTPKFFLNKFGVDIKTLRPDQLSF